MILGTPEMWGQMLSTLQQQHFWHPCHKISINDYHSSNSEAPEYVMTKPAAMGDAIRQTRSMCRMTAHCTAQPQAVQHVHMRMNVQHVLYHYVSANEADSMTVTEQVMDIICSP